MKLNVNFLLLKNLGLAIRTRYTVTSEQVENSSKSTEKGHLRGLKTTDLLQTPPFNHKANARHMHLIMPIAMYNVMSYPMPVVFVSFVSIGIKEIKKSSDYGSYVILVLSKMAK